MKNIIQTAVLALPLALVNASLLPKHEKISLNGLQGSSTWWKTQFGEEFCDNLFSQVKEGYNAYLGFWTKTNYVGNYRPKNVQEYGQLVVDSNGGLRTMKVIIAPQGQAESWEIRSDYQWSKTMKRWCVHGNEAKISGKNTVKFGAENAEANNKRTEYRNAIKNLYFSLSCNQRKEAREIFLEIKSIFQIDVIDVLRIIQTVIKNHAEEMKFWANKLETQPEAMWQNPRDAFNFIKRADGEDIETAVRSGEVWDALISLLANMNRQEKLWVKKQIQLARKQTNKYGKKEDLEKLREFFRGLDEEAASKFDSSGCRFGDAPPVTCSDFESSKSASSRCTNYRTANGVCNNLGKSKDGSIYWGASAEPVARWLPQQYEDGVFRPQGWDKNEDDPTLYHGSVLPDVRRVSNLVMSLESKKSLTRHRIDFTPIRDNVRSHLVVVMGQYIDHDLDLVPLAKSNLDCATTCSNAQPCFPIELSNDDPKVTSTNLSNQRQKTLIEENGNFCLPFTRSAGVYGDKENSLVQTVRKTGEIPPRNQVNLITSFLDASTVYGSNEATSNRLRAFDGKGRMRVHEKYSDTGGRAFLPQRSGNSCIQSPERRESGQTISCADAGDVRASEHTTLTSMHTMWVRDHNLVADKLAELNPHWGEETLFQETRNIIAAFHQAITYNEYVPAILGEKLPDYTGYDANINPSISAQFLTASYRFGHNQLHPLVMRLNENFEQHREFPSMPLHRVFFSYYRVIDEGGVDPLIRGLIEFGAKKASGDNMMTDEMRERLFTTGSRGGFDLASLNLQRSRDHGLPQYNDWLEYCGFPKLNDFDELELTSDLNRWNQWIMREDLKKLYGHPGNMELWLAGLLEPHVGNSAVGKTFNCLIKKQFENIRNGDRFWYQNTEKDHRVFTDDQIAEIDEYTSAQLICRTTGVQEVQPKALFNVNQDNLRVSCDSDKIPKLDLTPWKEKFDAKCAFNLIRDRVDFTRVSYKVCSSNPNKILFSCRMAGFKLTGASYATCDKNTKRMRYSGNDPAPSCIDENSELNTGNGVCDVAKKNNCGFWGVTKKACQARGCCWQESDVPGEPWCFYSSDDNDIAADSNDETDYYELPTGTDEEDYSIAH